MIEVPSIALGFITQMKLMARLHEILLQKNKLPPKRRLWWRWSLFRISFLQKTIIKIIWKKIPLDTATLVEINSERQQLQWILA